MAERKDNKMLFNAGVDLLTSFAVLLIYSSDTGSTEESKFAGKCKHNCVN